MVWSVNNDMSGTPESSAEVLLLSQPNVLDVERGGGNVSLALLPSGDCWVPCLDGLTFSGRAAHLCAIAKRWNALKTYGYGRARDVHNGAPGCNAFFGASRR